MLKSCVALSMLFAVVSCNDAVPPSPAAPAEPAAPPASAAATAEIIKRGAPIAGTTVVPLSQVLAAPAEYDGKTVLVSGEVRKACSRKGCWMELAPDASAGAQGCRVTFKDYGFFVPLDAAGSTAKVEGVINLKTVSKDDVDHLEGEGAKFATKEPDGSAKEVQIVASGVELTRS